MGYPIDWEGKLADSGAPSSHCARLRSALWIADQLHGQIWGLNRQQVLSLQLGVQVEPDKAMLRVPLQPDAQVRQVFDLQTFTDSRCRHDSIHTNRLTYQISIRRQLFGGPPEHGDLSTNSPAHTAQDATEDVDFNDTECHESEPRGWHHGAISGADQAH